MNRMFRNLFFYGVIFLVIIAVFGLFNSQNDEVKEYSYHEFTQALNNGEIKEMTFQPVNKIIRFTGTLEKDEAEFVAQVPDNTEIIAQITEQADRKSTRLNSSHVAISYAVFCLKKKKKKR